MTNPVKLQRSDILEMNRQFIRDGELFERLIETPNWQDKRVEVLDDALAKDGYSTLHKKAVDPVRYEKMELRLYYRFFLNAFAQFTQLDHIPARYVPQIHEWTYSDPIKSVPPGDAVGSKAYFQHQGYSGKDASYLAELFITKGKGVKGKEAREFITEIRKGFEESHLISKCLTRIQSKVTSQLNVLVYDIRLSILKDNAPRSESNSPVRFHLFASVFSPIANVLSPKKIAQFFSMTPRKAAALPKLETEEEEAERRLSVVQLPEILSPSEFESKESTPTDKDKAI